MAPAGLLGDGSAPLRGVLHGRARRWSERPLTRPRRASAPPAGRICRPCPSRAAPLRCGHRSSPGAAAPMALYLPHDGCLLGLHPVPAEGLPTDADGALPLANWGGQFGLFVPHHFDPDALRASPGVLAVREGWVIRGEDEVFHQGLTGVFATSGSHPVCCYFDHEHLLRDLG